MKPANVTNKIGVLLAFPPQTPLSNQGIGRLLTMLLNSRTANDTPRSSVIIAAPKWSRPDIEQLLTDNKIDLKSIELLYTKNMPLFMYVIRFMERFKRKGGGRLLRLLRRIGRPVLDTMRSIFIRLISSNPWVFQLLLTPLLIALTGAIVVGAGWLLMQRETWVDFSIFLGIAAAAALVYLYRVIGKHRIQRMLLPKLLGRNQQRIQQIKRLFMRPGLHQSKGIRANPVFYQLFLCIRQLELKMLTRQINKRNDVGMWYIPTPVWPEVVDIAAPKVVAVPDVVFIDYPSSFTSYGAAQTHEMIAKTLQMKNTYFLCYSQHVKERHLVRGFGVDPDRVRVIYHGRSELQQHLKGTNMRIAALAALRNYQHEVLVHNHYLRKFDFTQMRFFIFSSQARPYKNLLQLVKAYHQLLREERVNAKLVLTAKLDAAPEVQHYIEQHRLQMDVLFFHNIPSQLLAALNHLAIASINPSLFEGGFPFTFSEAYSVGTPSIMADIPHVREIITDPALAETMLFDPYNIDSITQKMVWASQNRDALFAQQAALYDTLHSWDDAAEQYHRYFTNVREAFIPATESA